MALVAVWFQSFHFPLGLGIYFGLPFQSSLAVQCLIRLWPTDCQVRGCTLKERGEGVVWECR